MKRRSFLKLVGLSGLATACGYYPPPVTTRAKARSTLHQSLVDSGNLVIYTEREFGSNGQQDRGYFVTSINGLREQPDTRQWWVFSVNGKPIDCSPLNFVVKEGDQIVAELT